MTTDRQRQEHYRNELKKHRAHDRAVFKTYDEKRLEELRQANWEGKGQ